MLNDIVDSCCKQVVDELKAKGVDDAFTCKVKEFKGYRESSLALYRSYSQFRSRPIFWVNDIL